MYLLNEKQVEKLENETSVIIYENRKALIKSFLYEMEYSELWDIIVEQKDFYKETLNDNRVHRFFLVDKSNLYHEYYLFDTEYEFLDWYYNNVEKIIRKDVIKVLIAEYDFRIEDLMDTKIINIVVNSIIRNALYINEKSYLRNIQNLIEDYMIESKLIFLK